MYIPLGHLDSPVEYDKFHDLQLAPLKKDYHIIAVWMDVEIFTIQEFGVVQANGSTIRQMEKRIQDYIDSIKIEIHYDECNPAGDMKLGCEIVSVGPCSRKPESRPLFFIVSESGQPEPLPLGPVISPADTARMDSRLYRLIIVSRNPEGPTMPPRRLVFEDPNGHITIEGYNDDEKLDRWITINTAGMLDDCQQLFRESAIIELLMPKE